MNELEYTGISEFSWKPPFSNKEFTIGVDNDRKVTVTVGVLRYLCDELDNLKSCGDISSKVDFLIQFIYEQAEQDKD